MALALMADPRFSVQEYVAIDVAFEEEVAALRHAGATGVGLSFFTGPRAERPAIGSMVKILAAQEMAVTACWPSTPSILPIPGFPGAEHPDRRTRELITSMHAAEALRPEVFGCVTGPAGDLEVGRAYDAVVTGLRAVADAAGELGIDVVVEPIHPSNAPLFSIVSTLDDVATLIDDVAVPNLGMVFDMWHSWGDPNLLAGIAAHRDKIRLVHLSDWRDPTRSWCDRALPGEGVADVTGMLGALDEAGYDGWYELEVLSDDGTYDEDYPDSLWHLDLETLVRRARRGFLETWRNRQRRERAAR